MKKNGLLLISLLVLSGFMALAATTQPAQAQDSNQTIYIGVVTGELLYNETEINLEPATTYTIVFVNDDPTGNHNLRIDVNGDLEDNGNIDDSEDIVIGVANDASGSQGTFNATWTTPDENTEVIFYCGFQGHYASGMEGVFIIGEGSAPGFGFVFAFAAMLVTALAIPRLRRN